MGVAEVSYVLDKLLVNLLDFKVLAFNFHFSTLEFFDKGLQLVGVILVERSGNPLVLSVEGQHSIEDHVELLGDAEFFPTSDGHLLAIRRIRVAETLLEIMGLDLEGDLDFSCNAS